MLINTRYDLVKEINANGYKTGVEVGVCEGYFSYYLLKHSKLKLLYSIDPWVDSHGEQNYQNAKSMLDPFISRSVISRLPSMAAVRSPVFHNSTNGSFPNPDFVYIDANHRYKYVRDDIAAWWNVLSPGGMLSGHDYIKTRGCGVIQAVDDFVARERLELRVTNEYLASWYVQKPKE